MNNTEQILRQIKELFLNLNFKETEINGRINYVIDSIYCVPQYIESLGFLIEYADSFESAQKNWHEDGDSFPLDMGAGAILSGISEELRRYVLRFDKIIFQSAV